MGIASSSSTERNINGSSDDEYNVSYLIVRPQNGGIWDLMRYALWGDIESGIRFLESSDQAMLGGEAADHRWVIFLSIIAQKILHLISKPLGSTGYVVDYFLNLISQNGSLFGLFYNLLHGEVIIPKRGTGTFLSTIGQLDDRIELYKGKKVVEELQKNPASGSGKGICKFELDKRAIMDLCIMASKLAYENAEVVTNVVVHHWQMHLIGFYNCWDDYQKEKCTQVIMLSDKPKDANLILVSFRGTEPFSAVDWCTDCDYSWYEVPNVGKLHMGFLEALGLGNREDASTFRNHLQKKSTDRQTNSNANSNSEGMTAYYMVREKLRTLLEEHGNAKFIVTGHSLGGALAIMFPIVLAIHEEMKLMQKLLVVYTFGQPRVGDKQLGKFMEPHLNHPVPKYFRVVYCNDAVPRVPCDDKTFLYKHFGVCLYYDSCFSEQIMEEEPNKNDLEIKYMIPEYLNAVWELIRGLTMGYIYGPEYKEGWFSICFRVVGLAVPGISSHCTTNYIDSVRLGK